MSNELLHAFSGNPLDRGDQLRRDPVWLADAAKSSRTRYLPLWRLQVPVQDGAQTQLGWVSYDVVQGIASDEPPIFLGVLGDVAHFGVDVSNVDEPTAALGLSDGWRFEDARAAASQLPSADLGILAQCRSQLDWHRRHRFCSVCGAQTVQDRGGHVRICQDCGAEHFPRTDPVAIMVIADGDRCLLGQSQGRLASSGMYSALAGFIDQGESIEEAVRREVREEAGIEVGAVTYHSSQPWPFASSLMIGCLGVATTTDIEIDSNEMADVSWFPRHEVHRALAGDHETLRVPGPVAIAHHLIKAWALGS